MPDPAPDAFAAAGAAAGAGGAAAPAVTAVPYTKWYNLHERYTLNDFKIEGIIFGLMVIVLLVHFVGTRLNRSKARAWAKAHAQLLAGEFALVGFGRVPAALASQEDEGAALEALASATTSSDPSTLVKENSLFEFASYATGRQNVAFVDTKLKLIKRFNPFMVIAEYILSFFLESQPAPSDTLEATLYPFDGKETLTVPGLTGGANKSTYDGFVWAIVNKDRMKGVRDDRFDVSITFTKDHAKLPPWLTVMSESAEITEALLTPELIKAAEVAGESLDYLIISDQPIDKPTTYVPQYSLFCDFWLPLTALASTRRPPGSACSSSTACPRTTTTSPSCPSTRTLCAPPTCSCRPRTCAPRFCARSRAPATRFPSRSARPMRRRRPRSAPLSVRSCASRSAMPS